MNIAGRIAKALLFLPLAEIVVFVLVAVAIGFLNAVLLTLATSILGAIVLRIAGRAHLRHFRSSLAEGVEITGDAAGRGLFLVLAGVLLLIPGFITDVAGLLILLPATRRGIGSFIGASLTGVMRRGPDGNRVVDLDPDEWQRQDDRNPPHTGEPPRIVWQPRRN